MKTLILLFGLLIPVLTQGQPYSIGWYKVAGGGGTSAGTNGSSVYSINGIIGQPDASPVMTGDAYSVTGGFWSLVSVVQTVGAPTLTIAFSGSSVIVSWPNYGNYTLQQNNNLAVHSGWTTSGYTVSTNGTIDSVTIPSPTDALFFRLANP